MIYSVRFSREDFIAITVALVTVVSLFWADEGRFSFQWMTEGGAWFVFLLYTGGLVLGEWIMSRLLPERFTGAKRIALIVTTGIPLGLGITIAGMQLLRIFIGLCS